MPSVYRPLVNFVAKAMQAVLNLALLCLGIILVVFLGKETLHLAHVPVSYTHLTLPTIYSV